MRQRLTTYLSLTALALAWAAAMITWAPDAVEASITVLRDLF